VCEIFSSNLFQQREKIVKLSKVIKLLKFVNHRSVGITDNNNIQAFRETALVRIN
jgi:DNA polymerase III alpha subunit (gram-positive type)